ncbi:MAG TPA: methyltransferase [Chthoniobacteraceae bacterium]|jgi:predicted O-methyltransferase YrrM
MSPLLVEPATDPLELYRLRDGIYGVDLLAAGIAHLDLFTWLADHPATLGSICVHFDLHVRPADVMMTLFTAMKLVTQSGGCFHLTLRAREHLVKGSPWYLAPYYTALKDRPQTLDMLKVLRTGKPANWGSYKDEDAWAAAMEKPEFAEQFTAAMDCRGVYLGHALAAKVDLADRKTLLDIGGGSGIYACCFAARHPELRATVFEKPPVNRIAREAVARQGFSERVNVLAGDMFAEPLPTGFDTHLISNVLHDWDEPVVRELLRSSYSALPEGGLLIVHDCHVNADKTGPLAVAQYSALLMHSTEGKCYSIGEMRSYLGDAGFEWQTHQPTAGDRSYIAAIKY